LIKTAPISSTFALIKTASEKQLLPLYFDTQNLLLLIVGGGNVALEKLNQLLSISPRTKTRIVANSISNELKCVAEASETIEICERNYSIADFEEADVIIVAVESVVEKRQMKTDALAKGKLIHVAGDPSASNFFLDYNSEEDNTSKIAETREKREERIGNNIQDILKNLQTYEFGVNELFDEKVKQLNDITKVLLAKQINLKKVSTPVSKKWQSIVFFSLLAFLFMILGHTILSFIPFKDIVNYAGKIPAYVDTESFLLMMLCGFLAQMADGSLGMGYGTISTTFLLANGVNPAIVSSRVHAARVFSSGVSGFSHHRFGNINKKLFRTLVIPGVIGAVCGATLAFFAQKYSDWVRIPVSFYTIYLGVFIIRKAYKKRNPENKVKRAGWLATAGGFLDAFSGGGYGSLVTSTLISKRKSPRFVIGSVCLSEFFVVLASSITFFIFLKSIPFLDVAGLIIGGLIAAPIAVRLVGKLPLKIMFLLIGSLVILTSIYTIWRVFSHL